MEVKEILDNAREYVERGWCQNILENIEGTAWCALGALAMGTCGSTKIHLSYHECLPDYIKASQILTSVVREDDPEGFGIASWNNDPRRTQEDVILAFKKASYNCEQESE